MSLPTTVAEVVERLREIDDALPATDGVAVFNRVYLTVTERVAEILAAGGQSVFSDTDMMAELDVRFANLWIAAYDADAAGRRPDPPWRPLFETRRGGRVPVQYAIAGMNSHIEHDLPVAVVDTCTARGLEPDAVHLDYEAVNDVLAQVESEIRRSFLDEVGRALDDRWGPAVHLVSAWKIDKARDLSWVTAQTIWALRDVGVLHDHFRDGLAHTVGLTSRALLAPTL